MIWLMSSSPQKLVARCERMQKARLAFYFDPEACERNRQNLRRAYAKVALGHKNGRCRIEKIEALFKYIKS